MTSTVDRCLHIAPLTPLLWLFIVPQDPSILIPPPACHSSSHNHHPALVPSRHRSASHQLPQLPSIFTPWQRENVPPHFSNSDSASRISVPLVDRNGIVRSIPDRSFYIHVTDCLGRNMFSSHIHILSQNQILRLCFQNKQQHLVTFCENKWQRIVAVSRPLTWPWGRWDRCQHLVNKACCIVLWS